MLMWSRCYKAIQNVVLNRCSSRAAEKNYEQTTENFHPTTHINSQSNRQAASMF